MNCEYCGEEILPHEKANSGGDFHQECLFRLGAGSAGHINHTCSCYGGTVEDPPGMTRREAARAAVRAWEDRQGWMSFAA